MDIDVQSGSDLFLAQPRPSPWYQKDRGESNYTRGITVRNKFTKNVKVTPSRNLDQGLNV